MNEDSNDTANHIHRRAWLAPVAIALISLPFWIGAIILSWDAAYLPEKAGNLAKARCWQSAVFAFGLACGISGSAAALWLKSWRSKAVGIAGTLLGFAGLSLSLIMGWYIDRAGTARTVSLLPFVVPSALVFAALMVLINSVRFTEDSADDGSDEPDPHHSSF